MAEGIPSAMVRFVQAAVHVDTTPISVTAATTSAAGPGLGLSSAPGPGLATGSGPANNTDNLGSQPTPTHTSRPRPLHLLPRAAGVYLSQAMYQLSSRVQNRGHLLAVGAPAALTSLFVNAGVRFQTQATRTERDAHGHGAGPGQVPGLGQGQDEDVTMMMVDDFSDVAMASGDNNNHDSNNNNKNNSSSCSNIDHTTADPTPSPQTITSQNTTHQQSVPSQPLQRRPLSQSSHWLTGPSATPTHPHPILPDHFAYPPPSGLTSSSSGSGSNSHNRQLQWEQKRELMAINERIHLMEVTLLSLLPFFPFVWHHLALPMISRFFPLPFSSSSSSSSCLLSGDILLS